MQMQDGTFGRGNDVGCGTCPRGLRNLDLPGHAKDFGNRIQCGQRLGTGSGAEVAAGTGDAQSGDARRQVGGLVDAVGARWVVRVGTGHRVVGKRQIGSVAGEGPSIEQRRRESCRRVATEGGGPKMRKTKARGSAVGVEPSAIGFGPPATAAPIRRTNRRSCVMSRGLREGRRGSSRW
jgi:hypothetical protein